MNVQKITKYIRCQEFNLFKSQHANIIISRNKFMHSRNQGFTLLGGSLKFLKIFKKFHELAKISF